MTIKEKVKQNKTLLKEIKTHKQLTEWAKNNRMDNRVAFSNFKKALKEIGIDYDSMRDASRSEDIKKKANELEKLEASNKTIKLFSDAKASNDRYAICDQDGEVTWTGYFKEDYKLEQSYSEMEAAKKAVWLAKKVKETNNLESINLHLKVDAKWLTYANFVKKGRKEGGKARPLGYLAHRYNVNLTVEHIAGSENPADEFTKKSQKGYIPWRNNIENIKLK